MKKIILFILVIVIIAFVIHLNRKRGSEYFSNYLDKMIQSGEEKKIDEFTGFFSIHYRDKNGINYIYLRKIIESQFNKYESFEASYNNLDVSKNYKDKSGNTLIDINIDVMVTGYQEGIPVEILGESGHPDNITLTLRRSFPNSWKIVSVRDIDSNRDY